MYHRSSLTVGIEGELRLLSFTRLRTQIQIALLMECGRGVSPRTQPTFECYCCGIPGMDGDSQGGHGKRVRHAGVRHITHHRFQRLGPRKPGARGRSAAVPSEIRGNPDAAPLPGGVVAFDSSSRSLRVAVPIRCGIPALDHEGGRFS